MNTRKLTTLGLLLVTLLSATGARADGFSDVQGALRLKRAGKGITGAAIALHIVGTALVLGALGAGMSGLREGGAAVQEQSSEGALTATRMSGIGLLAASGALAVVGIPMWSIGARRARQARTTIGATASGMVLHF